MHPVARLRTLVRPALCLLSLLAGGMSLAAQSGDANLHIASPWARATPPVATVGAVYLEIHAASTADTLLGATTPAADRVEMHTTVDNNGTLQMRPVERVPVEPGKTTSLRPGGLHLMLMGLKAPLDEGAKVPVTLRFEKAGELTVEASVLKGPPATSPAHAHH